MQKARIERAVCVRGGSEVLVTLSYEGRPPRTHTYRVPFSVYEQAGAPVAQDTVSGEALSLLTEKEDERLALARAMKILAAGDNTERALLRKLCTRGFSVDVAKRAVSFLREKGYIREDEMLLRQFAVFAKRMWGPKKFMPALLQKGFARQDVLSAYEKAQEEGIYDKDAICRALLSSFPEEDTAARRAVLYKHGF